MTRRHSLVVADDHRLVLHALVKLIEAERDFKIVASCADGESALAAIRTHSPDLALLDVRMPKIDGVTLVHTLRRDCPRTRVILLSAELDDPDVYASVSAGVWGLVLKEAAPDLLLRCLRHVAGGERWLPPPFVPQALAREQLRRKKISDLANLLTARERGVIELLSRGYSNKEIGKELGLSAGTVKQHVHHIYRKLSVNKRSALAELGKRFLEQIADGNEVGSKSQKDHR